VCERDLVRERAGLTGQKKLKRPDLAISSLKKAKS